MYNIFFQRLRPPHHRVSHIFIFYQTHYLYTHTHTHRELAVKTSPARWLARTGICGMGVGGRRGKENAAPAIRSGVDPLVWTEDGLARRRTYTLRVRRRRRRLRSSTTTTTKRKSPTPSARRGEWKDIRRREHRTR